jgi:hypothetical protein
MGARVGTTIVAPTKVARLQRFNPRRPAASKEALLMSGNIHCTRNADPRQRHKIN